DWVVETTRPALRAVAAEHYRDFLLLRPALADALRQRLADLEIPPDETRDLALLLQPAPVVPSAAQGVSSAAAESIQTFMLGPFELRASGARISDRGWRTSKAKELFALLLLDRQRAISRDELVAQLWPETDAASALSNFHFTLHALRKELATLELEWKEPREAVRPLEKLLQREPYDEEAHRLLMRAHHESGDAALAMRHYQALEAMLRRDLGAEPEAATRELYQRIKRK